MKIKEKSIKKNVMYNILLLFFNLGFPFVTGAYVSRTLGANNLGLVNFSQSIINWIIIFASIGIPTYGIREISKVRDRKKELSKVFYELMGIKIIISIVLIVLFYGSIFVIPQFKSNNILFVITGTMLIFNIFNIDWFFNGIEDYKILTLRNIFIKIVIFVLILIFVKSENQFLRYAFFLCIGQSLSNLWSYFYSLKFIDNSVLKKKEFDFKRHYKSLKIFLISSLLISTYTIMNSILVGFMGDSEGVAFFVRSKQIIGMGLGLTGAISTVLVPRISYYFNNEKDKYFELLNKSLDYNYIISIPITVGLIFLAKPLNLLLGGEQFVPAAKSLIILSPLVVIISVGTWGYFQIIIPMGKEKFGTKIQLIVAILSLILNVILIPRGNYIGAAIANLISETTGHLFSFYLLRKSVKFNLITKSLKKYLLAAFILYIVLNILESKFENYILIVVSIIFGSMIYFISLILMKETIISSLINEIKKILSKKIIKI